MLRMAIILFFMLLSLPAHAQITYDEFLKHNSSSSCSEIIESNESNSSILCRKGNNGLIKYQLDENNIVVKVLLSETVICPLFTMFVHMCNPIDNLDKRIEELKEKGVLG